MTDEASVRLSGASRGSEHGAPPLLHAAYPRPIFTRNPQVRAEAQQMAQGLMVRLRAWRVEQALTREGLAELADLPVSTIKRAERSGHISLDRFLAIAMSLGLTGDLHKVFMFRRREVPSLVLGTRMRRRKRGRRADRERAARRAES